MLPLASAGAVLTDPFLALGVTLSMTSFLLARATAPVVALWFFCGPGDRPVVHGPLALVLVAAAVLSGCVARRTRAVARCPGSAARS